LSKDGPKRLSIRFPGDIVRAVREFRAGHPAWDSLAFGPKVVAMLREFLGLSQGSQGGVGAETDQKEEPLPALLARANLAEASSETGIAEERLIALRSGDRATELEAIDLAHYLKVETSTIYHRPNQEAAHEHHC
jgi:hypothetical protein